ncbi:MAG: hypothetical protein QM581_05820 [Pseudomonas sp.]
MSSDSLREPVAPAAENLARTHWRLLLGVTVLAFVLRVLAALPPAFHHPDEVWQYLEPAHHLVFDRWVVAWEYRDGIRTWLIPLLLAGPMKLGALIAPDSGLYLLLPKLLLVVLSLSVVVSSTLMGLRISRLHGVMAGLVTATWAELVYFGPRAMSEPVSLALFFPVAWLLCRPAAQRSAATYLSAGVLLGLCFSARFQLAPALGVIALWACRLQWRAWTWLIAGGLLGLGVDALVDGLVGGHPPLMWIYENFHINLVENKSAIYGVDPPYWYLTRIANVWRLAFLAIVPLMIVGARRYPALLMVAVVNVLAHSAIPHKEYRFVLLSVALMVFLAAIGSVDVLQRYKFGSDGRRERAFRWIVLAWLVASLLVGVAGPLKRQWKGGRALVTALQLAGNDSRTCGFALYQPPHPLTAAYVYYHRDTPLYLFTGADAAEALKYQDAFNVVLSNGNVPVLSERYKLVGCTSGAYCVYRRPGACHGVVPAEYDVNAVLSRLGK